MKSAVIKCIATGLYSGFMKPYPGTWGTVPAWLIAFFLIGDNPALMALAIAFAFGVSVWSSGVVEKELGHDSRKIVIDEWVGMLVSVLFVPFSPATYAMAFVAFRVYDVIKLPPAAQFEKLPGGWGITMDDVVAGIQANVTVQVVVFVAHKYFDYSFV